MKNFKKTQLLVLLMVAGIFFACGEDKAVKEEARASLTTTAPDNKVKPSDAGTPKAADVAAAPAGPTTTITFEESEFDFGTIKAGEKATHIYKFKNTGNEPLIISNAKGSCGCTVPSWPKEPIPVGGSGEIEVVFNSKGKKGKQSKRVTITANTDPAQTFLTIKGEVTPDPAEEAKKAAAKKAQ